MKWPRAASKVTSICIRSSLPFAWIGWVPFAPTTAHIPYHAMNDDRTHMMDVTWDAELAAFLLHEPMAFRLSHSLQNAFRYALRSHKTEVGARIRLNIFDHRSAFTDALCVLCHCFICHSNERERQQLLHHRIGHSTPANLSWANRARL